MPLHGLRRHAWVVPSRNSLDAGTKADLASFGADVTHKVMQTAPGSATEAQIATLEALASSLSMAHKRSADKVAAGRSH